MRIIHFLLVTESFFIEKKITPVLVSILLLICQPFDLGARSTLGLWKHFILFFNLLKIRTGIIFSSLKQKNKNNLRAGDLSVNPSCEINLQISHHLLS